MQEVLVSKIFNYASAPTKNVEGQFWFNPSTNVLSRFNGTVWKPITVSSDDVVVLTDGSKVSLTSYLNTQIAALAEGIDSKQDKLLYYSETTGETTSAIISVDNIKLNGKVAEGNNTKASGIYSHAEGGNTRASGNYSHAEGQNTSASGSYSHTEGSFTSASGNYSHVEGSNTKALSIYQHVQGKYNIEDANDKYADIIGNGTSISAKSNAATVSWDGISWSQTDVRAGGTDQDSAAHSLSAKQNATDNNLTTTDKTIVGAINELDSEVATNTTNIRTLQTSLAGTLYFDNGKLSGSNFTIPTFPFSICATVRIDAWRSTSENTQSIFQYGQLGDGTGSIFALSFINGESNPKLRLKIMDTIDGANKSTSAECALNLSNFLGKIHTIVGICRAVTAEALNWDIYIDGVKQNISLNQKNVIVDSLSGTRAWAVNTSNENFSSQPASANPMMLRNLYIFNFDVSAEDAPYSIADYEAGRLIPPELKPSQVSLALENYTIARNATTTLVKDTSGNSNDATVKGNVAGDNDQSIKVFVDEIKTQINQSNG